MFRVLLCTWLHECWDYPYLHFFITFVLSLGCLARQTAKHHEKMGDPHCSDRSRRFSALWRRDHHSISVLSAIEGLGYGHRCFSTLCGADHLPDSPCALFDTTIWYFNHQQMGYAPVMIATLTLVLVFEESSRLAAAYGFAVTGTMTVTSLMYFQITRIKWHWPLWQSVSLLGLFLFFDSAFLGANMLKVLDGGWITICIATYIATSMITWRDGRALLAKHYSLMRLPTEVFLRDIAEHSPPRTSGTAVFMSITPEGIPHTLVHYLKHTEALHQRVLLLSVVSRETPTVTLDDRLTVTDLGQGFYRITVGYGFMESPDLTKIIEQLSKNGLAIDIYSTSFFLNRENLLATGPAPMAQWRKHLFIFMSRNAWNASSFFKLPPDRVVELGNQVQL